MLKGIVENTNLYAEQFLNQQTSDPSPMGQEANMLAELKKFLSHGHSDEVDTLPFHRGLLGHIIATFLQQNVSSDVLKHAHFTLLLRLLP